jgi:hypothetical protein
MDLATTLSSLLVPGKLLYDVLCLNIAFFFCFFFLLGARGAAILIIP